MVVKDFIFFKGLSDGLFTYVIKRVIQINPNVKHKGLQTIICALIFYDDTRTNSFCER